MEGKITGRGTKRRVEKSTARVVELHNRDHKLSVFLHANYRKTSLPLGDFTRNLDKEYMKSCDN